MLGLPGRIFLKLIGGSRNERIVRARIATVRGKINPLEDRMRAMSDEELLAQTAMLKGRLAGGAGVGDVLPEAFATVREASRRAINIRHFDVQLVAGMILHEGWIAEEATGEGKTFACYPAIYLAVLEGMHVHVVTTNDYLVKRDADLARQVFERLGVTVGYITSDMPAYGEGAKDRKASYSCNVTYGTNSEFGFDYLRDNMKTSLAEQVQGPLDFAIIDEVDSILIDEARTPLIISGPAYGQTDRFRKADAVARELIARNRPWDQANRQVEALKREIKALGGESGKGKGDDADKARRRLTQAQNELQQAEAKLESLTRHYEVEMDKKSVHMTHEGVAAAQEIAGVGSFYVGANMEWPHLMEQALRAHLVFEKDKDYVVQDGKVVIVDEFTGRLLEGREWSDGLHQAADAKERVPIKDENQTMATITYQNFFKLYKRLAGMTGTAMTEAGEFLKIYKLDVVSVPTHRPVNRIDHNDRIFGEVEAKFSAIAEEVNTYSKMGRPVLVGTTSIEKSEKLSDMLVRRFGIEHQVLNARPENATREAQIVLHAGQRRALKKDSDQMVGTVTIATNMAGRGVDIKLGEGVVWHNCRVPSAEKLAELGVQPEALFPSGSNKCCIFCPQYDPATNCAHCFKPKLDPDFPARGRSKCREVVPCGLHIVGTERHEARRIDNQLRGRSGRQGDPGSSRFFLSLRDDLMAIFAGEWTLKVLGWLGLQGDMAIEDRRVSKGVERAQRKVEERNFEIRKNLLEYDEVMDFQRRAFYG
ncbi:MAG: preprotein translocase subunit SecA, partial [Planctomycetes bacterium]|nr:preprotein translocase subunit SecA [Planctomycetota bacterium]